MFDAPLKVAGLMRGFEPEWFVAGGWAIDLFLGEETRPHADIEIAVFRKDQLILQQHFSGWQLKKAVNGELDDWHENDFLQLPVHEIHCFNQTREPHVLEVLLNEESGGEWLFRRDGRITKPLSELYLTSNSAIKFLRPEIVLLYKSKNPRSKDDLDFAATFARLDAESRSWLKNALEICDEKHHWLKQFSDI